MSKCPICEKPTAELSKPFCSERCRLVDLNRWFTGSYAVPSAEIEDIDAETMDDIYPPENHS